MQYFVATQMDVTERLHDLQARTTLLHEADHRVKNTLQMIAALVATQMLAVPEGPRARRSRRRSGGSRRWRLCTGGCTSPTTSPRSRSPTSCRTS
ncbi:histidine kinase dimerization/phosphoacceptor domain -containing protein [Methylobacterium gregans]|uniref:histidine kinase dimerization/phosphoacceptor domain -containing protein n=1 Tax=Methylobacterium gregans TaxID=374424 RepID=UPI003619B37C